MANFFEKLKKGMGIEIPVEEGLKEKQTTTRLRAKSPASEERAPEKPKIKKPKKLKIEVRPIEPEFKKKEIPEAKKEKWFEPEGELSVDVYQTDGELVIQSAIAGIKPEDLDISIEGDRVLIKGSREKPEEQEKRNYFYQECYWGPFSRQVILSEEVDPGRAEASMKEGILTIRIPKIERKRKRKIVIKKLT